MKAWGSRHEYARTLGRRVSRGEWERITHVFAVHMVKSRRRGVSMTLVLHPRTPRHTARADKYRDGPRARYAPHVQSQGILSRQRLNKYDPT